jgi:hypothetical protein
MKEQGSRNKMEESVMLAEVGVEGINDGRTLLSEIISIDRRLPIFLGLPRRKTALPRPSRTS